MNFPFYIARRYLFAKKSTNAINLISLISVLGIAIATAALVIVLSVFNGFHDLVSSFFTNIDPQLKVMPVEGKTAPADDPVLTEIRHLPQVETAVECLEDQVLAIYDGRQATVNVKGVDDDFAQLTQIDEILYGEGTFCLHAANLQYAVPGIQLAMNLNAGTGKSRFIQIFAPRRKGQLDLTNPTDAFLADSLLLSGVVFSSRQSAYDSRLILAPIAFTRQLFDAQGQLSSLEIRLKPGSDIAATKRTMRQIAAERFKVLDRYEQQSDTFRIMKIEKFIAYIFLTFILVIACFNIIGSLSMLMIDKRADVKTLQSLGAADRSIARIFLTEGRMIALMGALLGIVIGLTACLLQQRFGIIALGSSSGQFVVEAYPVSVHATDVLLVLATVIIVSALSVWYPVRYFSRRLLREGV